MLAITVTQTTEGVKCTELIIVVYVTAKITSLVSINILVQFGVKTWEYIMQLHYNNDVDDDVDVALIDCIASSSISKMFLL